MKFLSIVLVFFTLHSFCHVSDTINFKYCKLSFTLDSCHCELLNKHFFYTDNQLLKYDSLNLGFNYFRMLPSIGYNLGSGAKLTYSINLNLLYDLILYRKQKRIEKQKVISNCNLIIKNELVILNNLYSDYYLKVIQLNLLFEEYIIKCKIFDIQTKQFTNNEINTLTFLNLKADFINYKKNLYIAIDNINSIIQKISLLINYKLDYYNYEIINNIYTIK